MTFRDQVIGGGSPPFSSPSAACMSAFSLGSSKRLSCSTDVVASDHLAKGLLLGVTESNGEQRSYRRSSSAYRRLNDGGRSAPATRPAHRT